MKKQLLVICGMLVFLLVAWLPCYGGEIPHYQFLQEGYGYAPELGHFNNFHNFKSNNPWNKKPSQDEPVIDIYVNCSTGKDNPGFGFSPKKPFKTIIYAISRVPFMRDSSDFFVNINIAQGTYNESLTLNYDKVGLIGEGDDNTQIIGSEGVNTISVSNSNNIVIEGLKIMNGYFGINIASNSSAFISGTTVQDAAYNGIMASDSSYVSLNNCTIWNNGWGINIGENSHADFSGDISINSPGGFGIVIQQNSSSTVYPEASLTATDNLSGIRVEFGSSLTNFGSVICENNGEGMFIRDSCMFNPPSGEVLVENNAGDGIVAVNSYIITIGPVELLVENNGGCGVNVINGFIDFSHGDNIIIFYNNVDLNLEFGTRASIYGEPPTIGSISCDETVLTRGTVTCP